MFWGSKEKKPDDETIAEGTNTPSTRKQADINVFTVASGHLYEVSARNWHFCLLRLDWV